MSNVELIDLISDEKTHCISNKKIDGYYKNMLFNHMIESMSAETANNIFSNRNKRGNACIIYTGRDRNNH